MGGSARHRARPGLCIRHHNSPTINHRSSHLISTSLTKVIPAKSRTRAIALDILGLCTRCLDTLLLLSSPILDPPPLLPLTAPIPTRTVETHPQLHCLAAVMSLMEVYSQILCKASSSS